MIMIMELDISRIFYTQHLKDENGTVNNAETA